MQPVLGSDHCLRYQMCHLCLIATTPFVSCVPTACQCVPPRRAQPLALLAHAAFSTLSLAQCMGLPHPWHRGLYLPSLNFVRFQAVHFYSCHLLLLHKDKPAMTLQRDRNARQDTWSQYPIKKIARWEMDRIIE